MCVGLSELRAGMEHFATAFDAALVSAGRAAAIVGDAAAIEKMAAALKALAAARVADTELWRREGERSAAHHLARRTGTTVGQASDAIETARRPKRLPAT